MPNVLYGPSDSAIYHYEERLKALYPDVKDIGLLPKVFLKTNKVLNVLKISEDGLLVNFEHPGATSAYDAASIMTDKPIPLECGVYYFEVTIISKGVHGYIGVGLSDGRLASNAMPGWQVGSFGYHGDDGKKFDQRGTGIPYATRFTTGDVVGCCLNTIDSSVFYTKNGISLGEAFRGSFLEPLYPTIGLCTNGEMIRANFGQQQFAFPILEYVHAVIRERDLEER